MFEEICALWPEADVFTAVYDERGTEGRFAHRRIQTSFLQRLRPTERTFRALLPLYPYAIESLDLSGYDLVISSSSAWAHGVLPGEKTVHVCYCHNPFRYAWNERELTLASRPPLERVALRATFNRWRQWDWIAAQRVDAYVANSHTTERRIARFYGREARVLHPPVRTERFSPGPVGDHYLVVSELMTHKRIDVAVEAFNRLRLPLVVVGDGPESRRLRRLAGPTVRFEGRVSDRRVSELLASAKALVVTATEEFGIAAVEAHASGRPVIAYAEGGATETVTEGETGTLYSSPDASALCDAVLGFDPASVTTEACLASAARFNAKRFAAGLEEIVDRTVKAGPGRRADQRPRRRPLRVGPVLEPVRRGTSMR